mmetsp:Transcript_9295/g.13520  ORF Transcript_9295/g.13520 Transcript_9295/m.13520 type:complete len:112 (-) Transcript_9295:73-408(-)
MDGHDTQFPEVKRHAVLQGFATHTPHDMTAHVNACSQPAGDAEHEDCLEEDYSEGELDDYDDCGDDLETTLFGCGKRVGGGGTIRSGDGTSGNGVYSTRHIQILAARTSRA